MNFINIQEVADYIASNETEIKIRRGKKSDCKEVRRLIQTFHSSVHPLKMPAAVMAGETSGNKAKLGTRKILKELADFEKMPNGPKISYKVLEEDGFDRSPPLFHLFVAESPEDSEKLIAYALYYNKYSTWNGKAMILEDLYCSPEYRKKNVGSALFRAVVREAVNTGCRQMDFEVLGWNPARKFYEKLGAVDITETENWHFYRMTYDAMKALQSD